MSEIVAVFGIPFRVTALESQQDLLCQKLESLRCHTSLTDCETIRSVVLTLTHCSVHVIDGRTDRIATSRSVWVTTDWRRPDAWHALTVNLNSAELN